MSEIGFRAPGMTRRAAPVRGRATPTSDGSSGARRANLSFALVDDKGSAFGALYVDGVYWPASDDVLRFSASDLLALAVNIWNQATRTEYARVATALLKPKKPKVTEKIVNRDAEGRIVGLTETTT
jgi:hypothetical protein